jgi:hypothetical protein
MRLFHREQKTKREIYTVSLQHNFVRGNLRWVKPAFCVRLSMFIFLLADIKYNKRDQLQRKRSEKSCSIINKITRSKK